MNDTPEGRRVSAYLDTVSRLEPEVSPVDPDGARTSMAISQRRIADAAERAATTLERLAQLADVLLAAAKKANPAFAALLDTEEG